MITKEKLEISKGFSIQLTIDAELASGTDVMYASVEVAGGILEVVWPGFTEWPTIRGASEQEARLIIPKLKRVREELLDMYYNSLISIKKVNIYED